MRSDYNLDANQATHYFRCCLCGREWYDSLIRGCPEREKRKVCMYCCRLCSRSARSGSGLECRAADRARGKKKAG